MREDFDPQSLNDDDFLLQPIDEPAGALRSRPARTQPPEAQRRGVQTGRAPVLTPAQGASGPVYRVQVAAVVTAGRAEEVRGEVERAVGVPVYVQHDPPLYKIQAGDFRTKTEAEHFLGKAQGKGYAGAFLVSVSGARSPQPETGASGPPLEAAAQVQKERGLQMVPAQGYRVQVFSVTDRGEAQRFYEEARRRLNREDIYLQFEPPFFRVRVGNCQTRDAAEDLVRELEQAGYEAPFPVRTQILAPEAAQPKNE
ncbi:SPOR domain-containing protein [bacterium]|nr:SPOR domain-containing protein [bacterium]